MPLKRKSTGSRKVGSAGQIMEAVSYRISLPVTRIRRYTHGDTYPLCPRCGSCIEREYMRFCNSCGQRLSWRLFSIATVEHRHELE